MTVKSIIDIDVKSEEFSRFSKMFDAYQDQLAKTPEQWKDVEKVQSGIAAAIAKQTSFLVEQNEAARKNREEDERKLKQTKSTEGLWNNISKHSSTLYRNVLGVGQGMLKWGGILGGIATGVGLFGFDRLAESVAGTRQAAMGFNVSPAQLQAFGTNFNRIVDPGQFMTQMMAMETDPTQRRAWWNLMQGRQMTGDTQKDATAFLNAARQFAMTTPEANLGIMSRNLGLPFSVEELMRMRNTGNREWGRMETGAQRDVGAFGLSNRAGLAAQDFTTQMTRNRIQIMDSLWLALDRLAAPLGQLSAGLTHAAISVLGSPAVKAGIENLANWLKGFSGTIDSKGFTDKIKNFTSDAGVVADGLHKIAAVWNSIGGLGGVASGYAGAKVGGSIGSLFGPWGTVIGVVGGATIGTGAYDVHKAIDGSPLLQGPMSDSAGAALGGLGSVLFSRSDAIRQNIARAAARVDQLFAPANTLMSPLGTRQSVDIVIMNATGGSAVVAINGMAGN